MRMVFDSPATPPLPMSMLLLPVVRLEPAAEPTAMLLLPVVLPLRARTPAAVLSPPVVLLSRAPTPAAVLLLPVVFSSRANAPAAVFSPPVVFPSRANAPAAVLPPPVVLLSRANAPAAVLSLLPLLLLVSGVHVPPMVASTPAHVSLPAAAAAMVALVSTMSKAAARLRVKLVTVFIDFSTVRDFRFDSADRSDPPRERPPTGRFLPLPYKAQFWLPMDARAAI